MEQVPNPRLHIVNLHGVVKPSSRLVLFLLVFCVEPECLHSWGRIEIGCARNLHTVVFDAVELVSVGVMCACAFCSQVASSFVTKLLIQV